MEFQAFQHCSCCWLVRWGQVAIAIPRKIGALSHHGKSFLCEPVCVIFEEAKYFAEILHLLSKRRRTVGQRRFLGAALLMAISNAWGCNPLSFTADFRHQTLAANSHRLILAWSGYHRYDRFDAVRAFECIQQRTALTSAVALVSTLGGGYYMTYHHSRAVWAAAAQMGLAVLLDDVDMFIRTWTHFAYIGAAAGCDRVGRWAGTVANRLAISAGLATDAPTRVATAVAARYVRRLSHARKRRTIELSRREEVHQHLEDRSLFTSIARALESRLPSVNMTHVLASGRRAVFA